MHKELRNMVAVGMCHCESSVKVQKKGSHPAGVLRGDFIELVAELHLERWTRYEQWRLKDIQSEIQ